MSGQGLAEFLVYWQAEGASYARHGDYDWMASLVPGKRVLEIGCGPGFSTQALLKRGCSVLAIDSESDCLAATRALNEDPALCLLQENLEQLTPAILEQCQTFSPDTVVCWLMGAPASVTGAMLDRSGEAVRRYREKMHRAIALLAGQLPSVRWLHLVDRTAIAWAAKDIGRETLARYHRDTTFLDLPWQVDRSCALYRRLSESNEAQRRLQRSHPTLRDAVPVLASLLAARST